MPVKLVETGEYICLHCKNTFQTYDDSVKHGGYKCPNPPRCKWCGTLKNGVKFATMRGVHSYYCERCLISTVV